MIYDYHNCRICNKINIIREVDQTCVSCYKVTVIEWLDLVESGVEITREEYIENKILGEKLKLVSNLNNIYLGLNMFYTPSQRLNSYVKFFVI